MEYQTFGTTDFKVSRMGLGCMSMSGAYGPADDAESIATLHRAFDAGINFLDTSASYGNGHNHELIRKALQGRRERIVIHSKTGSIVTDDGKQLGGASPEYLTMVCERSLKSLGIDCLDIFCLSRVDPDVPVEESIGAMARLVQQGKCRYIALSEAGPESIRRANAVHPIVSLQMAYSVWLREAENGNLEACREHGMGFMAYSVLGRGYLAGRDLAGLSSEGGRGATASDAASTDRRLQIANQFDAIAKEKSVTAAQLALAWALSKGPDIVPIPGCKSRTHLEDDLRALEIDLTPSDVAQLDALLPPGEGGAPRLPREQLYRPRG